MFANGVILVLGMAGPASCSGKWDHNSRTARQQLQHIYSPQSIDQELARLTKDLDLTLKQQRRSGICLRSTTI